MAIYSVTIKIINIDYHMFKCTLNCQLNKLLCTFYIYNARSFNCYHPLRCVKCSGQHHDNNNVLMTALKCPLKQNVVFVRDNLANYKGCSLLDL